MKGSTLGILLGALFAVAFVTTVVLAEDVLLADGGDTTTSETGASDSSLAQAGETEPSRTQALLEPGPGDWRTDMDTWKCTFNCTDKKTGKAVQVNQYVCVDNSITNLAQQSQAEKKCKQINTQQTFPAYTMCKFDSAAWANKDCWSLG